MGNGLRTTAGLRLMFRSRHADRGIISPPPATGEAVFEAVAEGITTS
jgi:hypothetical protein